MSLYEIDSSLVEPGFHLHDLETRLKVTLRFDKICIYEADNGNNNFSSWHREADDAMQNVRGTLIMDLPSSSADARNGGELMLKNAHQHTVLPFVKYPSNAKNITACLFHRRFWQCVTAISKGLKISLVFKVYEGLESLKIVKLPKQVMYRNDAYYALRRAVFNVELKTGEAIWCCNEEIAQAFAYLNDDVKILKVANKYPAANFVGERSTNDIPEDTSRRALTSSLDKSFENAFFVSSNGILTRSCLDDYDVNLENGIISPATLAIDYNDCCLDSPKNVVYNSRYRERFFVYLIDHLEKQVVNEEMAEDNDDDDEYTNVFVKPHNVFQHVPCIPVRRILGDDENRKVLDYKVHRVDGSFTTDRVTYYCGYLIMKTDGDDIERHFKHEAEWL